MIIRCAEEHDFEELRHFYDRMCEVLGEKDFLPEGDKGGFPPDEMIRGRSRRGVSLSALKMGGSLPHISWITIAMRRITQYAG